MPTYEAEISESIGITSKAEGNWLPGWAKRIPITIDKDKVDADLSDFPVMIHLSASSGISNDDVSAVFDELQSDGNRKKIAVTAEDGITECYVEIEKWDDANEQAWLWAKIPSVSPSEDTILFFYFDSSQSDNTTYVGDTGEAAAQSVWDSYFAAVYHMAEDPTGTIKDSTSNGNDLTSGGSMTETDLVDSVVGDGIDFDGGDDYMTRGDNNSLDITSAITLQAIINPDTYGYEYSAGKKNGRIYAKGTNYDFSILDQAPDFESMNFYNANTGSVHSNLHVIDLDTDQYIAVTYDGSDIKFYVDESPAGSTADASGMSGTANTDNLYVGNINSSTDRWFDGTIDENRISSTDRSAAWLKADYHSCWDTLATFGAVEVWEEMTAEQEGVIEETIGVADEVEAGVTYDAEIEESIGLADETEPGKVIDVEISDEAGISDETSAFNFSDWLRQNQDKCTIRYIFTLTGAADGENDIEIPIQSFQARRRSGNPSYLGVVIPSVDDYSAAISARPNGEMIIEMAYYYKGTEELREEILRADLEEIRLDEGSRNESITLIGHKTETYTPKVVVLTGVNYRYESNGNVKLRTSIPDLYLNPGDTIQYDTDEFTADLVSMWFDQRQNTMEVSETV